MAAFSLNTESGGLTLLNEEASLGNDPCHIRVDSWGKNLFVSNYSGGSLVVFPLAADGRIKKASSFFQNEGTGFNPLRQEASHIHSSLVTGSHIYSADLGLDYIMVYKLKYSEGRLEIGGNGRIKTGKGAGPRYFELNKSAEILYSINELDNTIDVISIKPEGGNREIIQSVSTLPWNFSGESYSADIHLSPAGCFLYCSNRGHDSISIFKVNNKTGFLTWVGFKPTGGGWPRSFMIDPSGNFLIVVNQRSDNSIVFRIDTGTGELSDPLQTIQVGEPVCVCFFHFQK